MPGGKRARRHLEPQSPDKAIAPLSGQDFRMEILRGKMLEFIRTGSVIGKSPITSMPHWGGIIPDWQRRGSSPT